MAPTLIIALDFSTEAAATHLVDQLDPTRCALKVGSELFTHFGPTWIKRLIARGFFVFLDLKFHDIPHTVSRACQVAAQMGVWMLTVHVSGGLAMLNAARDALASYGETRPRLVGVTVLTSFTASDLKTIGIVDPVPTQVTRLAHLAKQAGLDGVVSAAHEVPAIKAACGDAFITVTPGIRLPTSTQDDQARIVTPQEAWALGSDYLVVGRPITHAPNPLNVLNEFIRHDG